MGSHFCGGDTLHNVNSQATTTRTSKKAQNKNSKRTIEKSMRNVQLGAPSLCVRTMRAPMLESQLNGKEKNLHRLFPFTHNCVYGVCLKISIENANEKMTTKFDDDSNDSNDSNDTAYRSHG